MYTDSLIHFVQYNYIIIRKNYDNYRINNNSNNLDNNVNGRPRTIGNIIGVQCYLVIFVVVAGGCRGCTGGPGGVNRDPGVYRQIQGCRGGSRSMQRGIQGMYRWIHPEADRGDEGTCTLSAAG